MKPVVLCIMDGVGQREECHGNAVLAAHTPNLDMLKQKYGFSRLEASGSMVGLPEGQMGNSEVGHMNIGAGRVIYQPLELINHSIQDKTFFQNEEILQVMKHVKQEHSKLHIMGLLSDGGVHSHINHLLALLDMCKQNDIKDVYLHLCTDGRDVDPKSASAYISKVEEKLHEIGIGRIATIGGRYYTMDRDNNYDRLEKGYDAIVKGIGPKYTSTQEFIDENYKKGITDEFFIPSIFDENGTIEDNDGFITYNFRKDRLRELLTALTNPDFHDMDVIHFSNVKVLTMLPVVESVIAPHAFDDANPTNILGSCLEQNGLSQLRIAETEKYAHVTFFFDGGKEVDYEHEKKILIPSPKVATYDLKPEMSAYEITDALLQELDKNIFDMVILNFANGDMVGHTGVFDATVKAVEVVDECVGKIYHKVESLGGVMVITADHGNSDYMLDANDNVVTSHSTSLVPFIVTKKGLTLKDGKLGDIAPTILTLLGVSVPKEMTGDVLIVSRNERRMIFLQRLFLILSILSIIIFVSTYFYTRNENPSTSDVGIEENLQSFSNILKAKAITEGDGLYQNDDMYVFKGEIVSNYLEYDGYLWRIVSIDSNNQLHLILDDVVTQLAFGDTSDYEVSYVKRWLNQTLDGYSGVFASTIDDSSILSTSWCLDNTDCTNGSSALTFGLLTEEEYNASILDGTYLNNGISFWTITRKSANSLSYIDSTGVVKEANCHMMLGIRPMIVIRGNWNTFFGDGSKENPYRLEDSLKVHMGTYLSYSNLLWEIVSISGNSYQLVLSEPLTIDSNNLFSFSNSYNKFLPSEEGTLAYYLNHDFYNSLDKTYILESTWYTGEYTAETGFDYTNIYSDSVLAYVGLLHVGSMYVNDTYMITPASVGSVYATKDEMVEELSIGEPFTVKPSIFIKKDIVLGGNGTLEDPYIIQDR